MLTGVRKTLRKASERYHKYGDEFLSYIVRMYDGETWVSFVNAETKVQSKQWMHTHSPIKPKKFNNCCLPVRKLMATALCDRKGIHPTRDHNNARNLL
jgi:hypothetical protein